MKPLTFWNDSVPWISASAAFFMCQPVAADAEWGIHAAAGVDCYLIERATIIHQRKAEPEFGLANVGHQIAAGKNVVLSIREYESQGRGVDDQVFRKATLELNAVPSRLAAGQTRSAHVIRSYYTAGQPGFVEEGNFRRAADPIRSIKFSRNRHGTYVTVRATFWATAAFNGKEERQTVAWRCKLIRRTVDELNAWEGRPGTNTGSFYPRTPPPSSYQAVD